MECKDRPNKKETAAQKVNNFLASEYAKQYFITSTDIVVLYGVARFTHYFNEWSMSIKQMMEFTHLSERAVQRSLKSLEKMELISVQKQKGSRSVYSLTVPYVDVKVVYPSRKGDNYCA